MEKIEAHDKMEGLFMVNFVDPSVPDFKNSVLPAIIYPYTGPTSPERKRLRVEWFNGNTCVIEPDQINVYQLNQK